MLARYRRFRHILIFEQRNWPDRLVFALGSRRAVHRRGRRRACCSITTPPISRSKARCSRD